MPAKKDDNKVMDVNNPGTAAPSATSRPVIVSHKPMMADPMMSRTNPEIPTAPALAGKGRTIKPPGQSLKANALKPSKAVKKSAEVADETTEPTEQPEPKVETDKTQSAEPVVTSESSTDQEPEKPAESPVSQEPAAEAEPEEKPGTTAAKKKAETEAIEKAEHQKYEKMITDKTYFVPIDQTVSSSGGKVLKTLLAVALIALVAGVLLVDAGLIEAPVELPFDLIQS